jgi:ribonuclease P protein component
VALNRALRLRKNRDFQRVRQQGRSVASRFLILAWVPNDLSRVRVGIVVSKRISKHAVARNYSKRLLGEAIRPFLSELSGGWDVVLSARSSLLTADLAALRQDVEMLLRRARLLASVQTPEVSG